MLVIILINVLIHALVHTTQKHNQAQLINQHFYELCYYAMQEVVPPQPQLLPLRTLQATSSYHYLLLSSTIYDHACYGIIAILNLSPKKISNSERKGQLTLHVVEYKIVSVVQLFITLPVLMFLLTMQDGT